MAFLHTFPPAISAFQEATLNAFSLVVLSTPIIYFWAVKPFVKAHNDTLHQIEYYGTASTHCHPAGQPQI